MLLAWFAFSVVLQPCLAQQWDGQAGISSSEFLQLLPSATLHSDGTSHPFPQAAIANNTVDQVAKQVSFETPVSPAPSDLVHPANYESNPATVNAPPIGTGVGTLGPAMTYEQQTYLPPPAYAAVPGVPSQRSTWLNALKLDSNSPNYLVGFEVLGLRRSNDTVGPYSQGGRPGPFDREVAGRYTVSKLLGAIERLEFKFTGPFHWERQLESIGPVNSGLPASFSSPFQNADRHRQSQNVNLSSYELNRCVTGDEFSKFFYGLRLIDYEENYELQATRGATNSLFRLRTHNLMVGTQFGMDLHRPLSQRLNLGLGAAAGLYGNFVKGSLKSSSGSSTNLELNDDRLRLNMVLEAAGRVNYRISQNIFASGGYEFWYFPALATAANQRLDYVSTVPTYSLRSGDDQLFRGWTFGLSARF